MRASSKGDTALALVRKGFVVFPWRYEKELQPNGNTKYIKAPNLRFTEKASADEYQVLRWWAPVLPGEPEADHNIGILTDRLLVIEVDVKGGKPGLADLQRLVDRGLPTVAIAVSPSGGYHVYLRLPEGVFIQTTNTSWFTGLGEGIDIRSFHGFVGAPGSDGYDGLPAYKWLDGFEPKSVEDIPFAPQWLIDMCPKVSDPSAVSHTEDLDAADIVLDTPEAISRAIDFLENDAPESNQGDGGDGTALNVARDVRKFGTSSQKTLDLMLEHWNDTKANPPWSPEELEIKVRNAYTYNRKTPIGILSSQRDGFTPVVDDANGESLAGSEAPDARPVSSEDSSATDRSKVQIPPAAAPGPPRSGAIEFETFDEATAAAGIGDDEYLVKGLLDLEAFSVIYGAPNAGKSFAALELAHCIATGRDYAGLPVCQGGAVYIALEGVRGVRKRLKALRLAHPSADASRLFVARGDVDLFSTPKSQQELTAKILAAADQIDMPVRIVILDTLARAMGGGDENATAEMGAFVKRASGLGKATKTHICLVHHSGKDAAKGARGSTALRAAVDTEIEVKESAAGKREIAVRKQRDHEYLRLIPFGLKPVKIGTTKNLGDVMSCVVDFTASNSPAALASESDLPDKVRLALSALDIATENGAKKTSTKAWTRAMREHAKATGEELSPNACYSLRKRVEQAGLARAVSAGFWVRIATGSNITTMVMEKRGHGDVHGDDFPSIPEHHQNITNLKPKKKAA